MFHLLKFFTLLLTIVLVNTSDPKVSTTQGEISGKIAATPKGRTYNSFTGIPYAKPPVGKLRFKEPVPSDPWKGTLDASKGHAICPQLLYNYVFGDENCLFLNVYTPKLEDSNGNLLPVIFYIHGGGFAMGGADETWYGADLFLDRDVVLVTVNYRLGALGFLSTGNELVPGNNGLKDQALALKWVKKNIRAFGGDADNISVVGHSGGAVCSHLLSFSPLSKDLVKRVVAQSGSALHVWAFKQKEQLADNTRKLAKLVKCSKSTDEKMIGCLRKLKVGEIIKHQSQVTSEYDASMPFGPTIEPNIEGAFISEHPEDILKSGNAADVTLLIGITTEDGGIRSAGYFANPESIKDLDVNFNEVVSRMLKYNDRDNRDSISAKMREFYFENNTINRETQQGLTDMFTDIIFGYGADKAVRLHMKYLKQPVYYYLFGYKGSASHSIHYGDAKHDYGVCHADELLYMFTLKSLFIKYQPTENDVKMSDSLTELWANFANTGKPTSDENGEHQWKPVSSDKMEYYYIKNASIQNMEEGLNLDRIKFLQSLEIFSGKKIKDEL